MKRSEMIGNIEEVLYNAIDSYGRINKDNIDKVADQLLIYIERKGMLPPISEHTSEETTPFGSTYYDIPEWENEND